MRKFSQKSVMWTDRERRYALHKELRKELVGTPVKFSVKHRTFIATQDQLDGLPLKTHNKIIECVQRFQYGIRLALA